MYIPEFHANLISIPRIATVLKCTIYFDSSKCLIHGNHSLRTIGTSKLTNGLYMLTFSSIFVPINTKHVVPNNSICFKSYNNISNRFNLCLNLLGHPSYDTIIHINKKIPLNITTKSTSICDTCFIAKQKRLPFYYNFTKSLTCFDIFHMDIWGPISTPSMFGHKHFLTIVDDYSRLCWIFLMKLKYETSPLI